MSPGEPALSPAERNRLVALLGMLGSSHDGEVTNAGRLAARMVRSKGLGWDQLVAGQAVQSYRPPPRPAPAGDARADLELAARHSHRLTEWELSFVGRVPAEAPRAVADHPAVAPSTNSANGLLARQ
jgi:hypothetical protein